LFPSGQFVPILGVNYGVYSSTYTDSFSVPTASPYKMVLDYRPQRGTVSITIAGAPAALIEGAPPQSAGVVSVDYFCGVVEFHSGDAGKAVVAQYKHFGTVLDAGLFNRLQYEVAAVADYLRAGVFAVQARTVFVPGMVEAGRVLGGFYLPASVAPYTVARVNAFCANRLSATGQTTLAVSTAETGPITHNSNGVICNALTTTNFATTRSASWQFTLTSGGWLYVRASEAGGHADCTVELLFA
jgi:hypothetical protein